jgi:hypothetical protein
MFDDLDSTLKAILDDPGAPLELRNADVSFETPDRNFTPAQATINLFLYDVRENRELRDPVPVTELVGTSFVRRRPPLRVDCMYLVTAWSNQVGPARNAEEHRLLAQALLWLSRFPVVPSTFLVGSLIGQPMPPPAMVAQVDGTKNAGEFWTALGSPPRPGFYLLVTIALQLQVERPEGPPVISKEIRMVDKANPAIVLADTFEIAGVITEAATLDPIADALITMMETGRSTRSAVDGRFRFTELPAGSYTLRTEAAGFGTEAKSIDVPAPSLNEYDMSLAP